jgi:hypothetical protein
VSDDVRVAGVAAPAGAGLPHFLLSPLFSTAVVTIESSGEQSQ